MNKSYIPLLGILLVFSLLVIPGVQAGHLKTQPQTIGFNLQSTETDTITLTTDNDYDIDLQFIALNPGGVPMPISSIVGFNTRIEETTDGFKWSYDLQLPNSDFVAKILVTSPIPITILNDKYVVVDGSIISFDDVLEYGYSYTLTKINDYVAEFEITKDYSAHGLSPGYYIMIDPTVTAYPTSDGYLRKDNVGAIDTFLTETELRVGVLDTIPDTGDYVYRTYFKHDTSQIDVYDSIINATLRIYLDSIVTSGGQNCTAMLYSISDYDDLGSLDWDISATTINSSFVFNTDATGIFYEEDISDYITKEGITAFQIKSNYETLNSEDCYFVFSSNETVNTPELEIYWTDGQPSPARELFNVTHPDSRQIFAEDNCLPSPLYASTRPYDPKIACETDGNSCVAVFYDSETLCSRGLKYSLSFDGFQTIEYHGIVTGYEFSQSIYLDPMEERGGELPYDIVYDDHSNHYYIALNNKIYVIPTFDPGVGGVTPYRVTDGYALAVGGTVGADMNFNVPAKVPGGWIGNPAYNCNSFKSYNPLRFNDNDPTSLSLVFSCQIFKPSPNDWDGATWLIDIDVTNRTGTGIDDYTYTELDQIVSCSAGSNFGWDAYSGYAEYSGTAWKYNIEGQIDYCTGTVDRAIEEDNFGSPNDDFNHFYFGGNLYWKNETVYYIYSSETSDLTSFATAELQYAENTIINEAINQSDGVSGGNANYYIWYRSSDLTDGTDGIWIQEEATYPVIVSSNEDVFVTISCPANDYTASGSGKIMQLFTPCLSGNTIQFVSDFTPQVDAQSLNFGSCDSVSYSLYYPDNPYDFTFTVKDALTNDVLENVEMDLTGEASETTNSNGQATFNIQAIDDDDLKVSY